MSRIDQALRRAEEAALLDQEGADVVDFSADREDAHAFPLDLEEYPREQQEPAGRQETWRPEPSRTVVAHRALAVVEPGSAPAPPEAKADLSEPWPGPSESAARPVPETAANPARWNPAWRSRLVVGSGADHALISVEQYRRLAAVLHDVQVERGVRTVMVTSTVPGEGKTLTVANLGLTLSGSYDRRVLLIDADLRRPSLHEVFGLPNTAGLSEVLSNSVRDLPIAPVTASLSLLPAGNTESSPLAGLTSDRMATLLEECAGQYDWVLIDTPPVGLLPDAQLLARLTRSVIFVIGAGSTPSALVERAVSELGPDCIIGTVLNRVEERTVPEIDYYAAYGGYHGAAEQTDS